MSSIIKMSFRYKIKDQSINNVNHYLFIITSQFVIYFWFVTKKESWCNNSSTVIFPSLKRLCNSLILRSSILDWVFFTCCHLRIYLRNQILNSIYFGFDRINTSTITMFSFTLCICRAEVITSVQGVNSARHI